MHLYSQFKNKRGIIQVIYGDVPKSKDMLQVDHIEVLVLSKCIRKCKNVWVSAQKMIMRVIWKL